MIQLGQYNRLRVTRFTEHGAYLDGEELGEILMPRSYVSESMKTNDEVEVFVYLDQSERLVGTLETPLARVGDFAFLRCTWVNKYGAFLNWGLMKDLFCPFAEQKEKMQKDKSYVVHIQIDDQTHRIVASEKIDRYLLPATPDLYHRGQEVEILLYKHTSLGFKAIVNNQHGGLVYEDQIFDELPRIGDVLSATIVTVRTDGKLDLSLQPIGKARFYSFAKQLFQQLHEAGGSLPFSDESSPAEIREQFGVSKKTFKRAIGTLLKAEKIVVFPYKIVEK